MRRFVDESGERFWEIEDMAPDHAAVTWRAGRQGEGAVEEERQEAATWLEGVKIYNAQVSAKLSEGWSEALPIDSRGATTPNGELVADPPESTHERRRVWWDEDKTRLKEECFVLRDTDDMDGPRRRWHPNGAIWEESVYEGDWLAHTVRFVDTQGHTLNHGDTREGTGLAKGYHPNGALEYHGAMSGGPSEGIWFYGHDNGRLHSIGEYVAGKKEGIWRNYHASGGLQKLWRVEGGVERHAHYFYEGGNLQAEGPGAHDDEGTYHRTGVWSFYNDAGVRYQRADYHEPGHLTLEHFDPETGVLQTRCPYVPGAGGNTRHGVMSFFDEQGRVTNLTEYDMGAQLPGSDDEAKQAAQVLNRAHSGPNNKLKALQEAFNENPRKWLAATLTALDQGLADPTLEFRLRAMESVYGNMAPQAMPLLKGIDPEQTQAAIEQRIQATLAEPHPNGDRVALWTLSLARVNMAALARDHEALIHRAMSTHNMLYNRSIVDPLRAVVSRLPLEMREAAILHSHSPLWVYAESCPTEKVIGACLKELVTWKRSEFTYAEYRRTAVLEALEGWGAAATPHILSVLDDGGYKAPHRALLARGLTIGAQPEAAEALLKLAGDGVADVREEATKGLAALGAEDLALLQRGAKARKKNVRIATAQALTMTSLTKRHETWAREWMASSKDAEVRELLQSLFAEETRPPGLVVMESRFGTWSDEEHEAWSARLARPEQWDRSTLLYQMAYQDPRVAFWAIHHLERAQESGESWLIESRGMRGTFYHLNEQEVPGATWLAARELHRRKENRYDAANALKDYANELFGAEVVRALSWMMAQSPAPNQKHYLKWMAEHYPADSVDALLTGLGDKSKPVRAACQGGLLKASAEVVPKLWPLLEGGSDQVRGAAEVLGHFPTPESIPHLEAALSATRSGNAKEAIESAISACRLAAPAGAEPTEAPESEGSDSGEASPEVDDEVRLAELDAQLAKRAKGRPPKLSPEPTLRWRHGVALSEKARKWLMGALKKEDQNTLNAELRQVAALLEATDRLALSEAIVAAFPPSSKNKWSLYQQAVLGDDDAMDAIGATLQQAVYSQSAAWAGHMVNVLTRLPTPAAVRWLDHWSAHAGTRKLKRDSRAAVQSLADAQGIRWDELVDDATPDLGFDAQRRQPLGEAPVRHEAALTLEGELHLLDPQGEALKQAPAVKGANATLLDELRTRWSALKRTHRHAATTASLRLEAAMIVGRRWHPSRWRAFVMRPLIQSLATRLVFVATDVDHAPLAWFRLSEAFEPVGADGSPVDIEAAAWIGLPHPVEFDDAGLDAWRQAFVGVQQPLKQLKRAFSETPEDDIEALISQKTLKPGVLLGRLEKRGYKPGFPEDAGMVYQATRGLTGRWGVSVSHEGYYAGDMRHPSQATIRVTHCGVEDLKEGSWERPRTMGLWCEALVDMQDVLK